MNCETCGRKMGRELRGKKIRWRCHKCNVFKWVEATEDDLRGAEAPPGCDPELWHMKKVLGQDKKDDRGPRQKFYRSLMDKSPFRFAEMVRSREKAAGAADDAGAIDAGHDKALALTVAMLADLEKKHSSPPS